MQQCFVYTSSLPDFSVDFRSDSRESNEVASKGWDQGRVWIAPSGAWRNFSLLSAPQCTGTITFLVFLRVLCLPKDSSVAVEAGAHFLQSS